MEPVERRGLGEILAWSIGTVCTFVLLVIGEIKNGKMDEILTGLFVGQITALLARGAQAAAERSALRSKPRPRQLRGDGRREPTGKVSTVIDDAPTTPRVTDDD